MSHAALTLLLLLFLNLPVLSAQCKAKYSLVLPTVVTKALRPLVRIKFLDRKASPPPGPVCAQT